MFVREQARAASLHHDVVIVADDGRSRVMRRPYELREGDEDGLRVMRATYRASRVPFVIPSEYLAAVLAAIRRLVREGRRPDVVHAHVYYAAQAALIAGRRHRIPVVVSEHSSHFVDGTLGAAARLRSRLVFGGADLVCPVSAYLQRVLEAQGVHARFRVVPNAVDPALYASTPAALARDAAGRARVLVVSGLHAVKNVGTLLHAVARVAGRRRDLHVDVIGDGPERGACERLIAELGLGALVTLHGYRDKAEIAERLRTASFLVLPSRTETFGVAAVEALAAGRPVLAARVGAIPELIDDDAGMLVDSPSEAALADGLDAMLDRFASFDPVRLSERAVARFGRQAVGAQWDEIYRGVVDGRAA